MEALILCVVIYLLIGIVSAVITLIRTNGCEISAFMWMFCYPILIPTFIVIYLIEGSKKNERQKI